MKFGTDDYARRRPTYVSEASSSRAKSSGSKAEPASARGQGSPWAVLNEKVQLFKYVRYAS